MKLLGIYDGVVVDNADPKRSGRLRVNVPGLIDDTGWAQPYGVWGGGGTGVGGGFIPDVGAEVVVQFTRGDPDSPRWTYGAWGESDAPAPLRDGPDPAGAKVIELARWRLLIDETEGQERLLLSDKNFPDDYIELDGVNHGVIVNGSAAVFIRAVGVVNIEGLQVFLNGRLVRDTGGEI